MNGKKFQNLVLTAKLKPDSSRLMSVGVKMSRVGVIFRGAVVLLC